MDYSTPNPVRSKPTCDWMSPVHIPPSPFMAKLGCGTGVVVYRLQHPVQRSPFINRSPWAVKKVRKNFRDCSERLMKEAEILRSLNHPNIVKFKCTAKTLDGDFCLSMEECDLSLDNLIENRSEQGKDMLLPHEITKVSLSMINALNYLHNEKKLLHGDIKSGNVLIKGNFDQVKLCDFGVSIYLKSDLSGPVNPGAVYIGTEPWKSPEVLEWNDGPITDKADIFAYGLVIWEMLTLKSPHIDLLLEDSKSASDSSFASDSTDDSTSGAYYDALGTRPPLPELEYGSDYDVAIETFLCSTQGNHELRPSAATIAKLLLEF